MKIINLTKGYFTIVDDEDFEYLSKFTWLANVQKKAGKIYAQAYVDGKHVYMHKMLIPGPHIVDHRDRDGLNNQKHNLRRCSKSQNSVNSKLSSTNTSGLRGAFWHEGAQKWMAQVHVDGRSVYLGLHATKELAHEAYRSYMLQKHGEFFETAECTRNP